MNSTPEELEELARLLPEVPVERGLPPGRHSHHKDLLLHVIDREHATSPTPRVFSRPALLAGVGVGVGAGVVALALTAGLTLGIGQHGHQGPQDDSRTVARPGVSSTRTASAGAVVTLDRIAAVAQRSDVSAVREDQFVYVRSRVAGNDGVFDGPVELGSPHVREVWFSQDPAPTTDVGLIREYGQDWPIEIGVPDGTDPQDPQAAGAPAGIDRSTYAWLASLPTDPDELLKLIYDQTRVEAGEDRDQTVFIRMGDLIGEQIMPSATAAAFYRAAARIPGVTELPDAVDAAGRHGIAISREDTVHGTRTEWIFDRKTLGYLGDRTVLSRDGKRGKAGTVFGTTAVLERAVVDKRGQKPA